MLHNIVGSNSESKSPLCCSLKPNIADTLAKNSHKKICGGYILIFGKTNTVK